MSDMQRTRARRSTGALAGAALVAAGTLTWSWQAGAALPSEGYADLVERVSPAVVFVSTKQQPKAVAQGEEREMPVPPGSPFGEFFKRFFDQARKPWCRVLCGSSRGWQTGSPRKGFHFIIGVAHGMVGHEMIPT